GWAAAGAEGTVGIEEVPPAGMNRVEVVQQPDALAAASLALKLFQRQPAAELAGVFVAESLGREIGVVLGAAVDPLPLRVLFQDPGNARQIGRLAGRTSRDRAHAVVVVPVHLTGQSER